MSAYLPKTVLWFGVPRKTGSGDRFDDYPTCFSFYGLAKNSLPFYF